MMEKIKDTVDAEMSLRIMLVEDDPGVSYALTRWLRDKNARPVLATTTHEAMDLLRDVVFIEGRFDALLVDYRLPDATGVRVIQEFQDGFPHVPVALMTGSEDITLEIWARARSIPLFRKPLQLDQIDAWLTMVRRTAHLAAKVRSAFPNSGERRIALTQPVVQA